MVEYYHDRFDDVFLALVHLARREIVRLLAKKAHNIGELVPHFGISFAAVSRHIKLFERAGILDRKVDGRVRTCCLSGKTLKKARAWLNNYERFWQARLVERIFAEES